MIDYDWSNFLLVVDDIGTIVSAHGQVVLIGVVGRLECVIAGRGVLVVCRGARCCCWTRIATVVLVATIQPIVVL